MKGRRLKLERCEGVRVRTGKEACTIVVSTSTSTAAIVLSWWIFLMDEIYRVLCGWFCDVGVRFTWLLAVIMVRDGNCEQKD